MPAPIANLTAALAQARAALVRGWRPGLSIRLPNGSIEWSAEGALRGELFRQGITDTADQDLVLQQLLTRLGVASFSELETTGGRAKAKGQVLAVFDAAAAKAQAKLGG